jgi:hypothetical protein
LFPLRATTKYADSRCSRRRSAREDGGTTLFRSVSFDEDGGNPANIAASGASNQTRAIARAAQEKWARVTEGRSSGCSAGWRVIIHAAMAAPATASSSATMTIINTVVETPTARLLVRSF